MADGPLTFTTDEEMIAELHRRYPDMVFVGLRPRMGATAEAEETETTRYYLRGSVATMLGLLELCKRDLLDGRVSREWDVREG